ncbi:MAG TPA: G1 family glutamic endopeptidase, partial [Acidimicrobiales bacterium]|nr:G1 family glutamic endopeptidase [Acidimicrobiales bacterium]
MRRLAAVVAAALLGLGLPAAGGAYGQETSASVTPVSQSANTGPRPVAEGSLAAAYARLATTASRSEEDGAVHVPPAGPRGLERYNAREDPKGAQNSPACSVPGNVCDLNWAGLEAWGDTFTGVSGQWSVPDVAETSTSAEDSSTWVGLDGDSTYDHSQDPPLLQLGTDSPSQDGTVSYEAWYELIPGAEIPVFAVSPGDQIQAVIVQAAANEWDLAITDLTTGVAWSASDVFYSALQ